MAFVHHIALRALPGGPQLKLASGQVGHGELGALGQSRHDLMPVEQLGRGGLVVPGQQRDRLHRHAMSRQQRQERVPKLPRHPRVTQPSRLGDHPELPPHVPRRRGGGDVAG